MTSLKLINVISMQCHEERGNCLFHPMFNHLTSQNSVLLTEPAEQTYMAEFSPPHTTAVENRDVSALNDGADSKELCFKVAES